MIIVNDGSRDKTFEFVQSLIDGKYQHKEIYGINYMKNGGKGFAVRTVLGKLK
jgi:glycosyltransferase involved in cell wall biosynthesis